MVTRIELLVRQVWLWNDARPSQRLGRTSNTRLIPSSSMPGRPPRRSSSASAARLAAKGHAGALGDEAA